MKKLLICVVTILVIVILAITGYAFAMTNNEHIYEGVSVEGVSLGGLTKDEAIEKLQAKFHPSELADRLQIKFGDNVLNFHFDKIQFHYDYDKAVERAYRQGRNGNMFQNTLLIHTLKQKPKNIPLSYTYNKPALQEEVAALAKEIYVAPVDAKISMKNGNFIYTDEVVGHELDQEKTVKAIIKALEDKGEKEINLSINTIEPKIRRAQLNEITKPLGQFTTQFNANKEARSNNIRLACKNITDYVLMPGEIFSTNEAIGQRTPKRGFKPAPVIVNGETEEDYGGGVCQVSTTLYNAALFSNLEIVSRRNHGLPSTYVPLGRDATINWGTIDFQFKNTTTAPIYIRATTSGGSITCSIYGKEETPNQAVKIITQTDQVIPPTVKEIKDDTLPIGETVVEKKGSTGYVVRSWRVVYENGVEVSRQFLAKDTYRMKEKVVRVGTKQEPVVSEPKQQTETVEDVI